MTPRRPDALFTRRSTGSPFTIVAAVALSACLLGSGALVAHADEGPAPAAAETTTTAAVPAPAAAASAPVSSTKESTPPLATATQDIAPAPIAPEAAPTAAAETPVVPAPETREAPAFEPAAATETPVSTPQQQPTPPAAATTDGVTATVRGALDLAPGEKPAVGTQVTWTTTITNTGDVPLHDVRIEGSTTSITLAAGETADIISTAELQPEEIAAKFAFRIVRVSGESPTGARVTVVARDSVLFPVQSEQVAVDTTGRLELQPGEQVTAGTRVTWNITIRNTGGSDLQGVFAQNEGDATERLALIAQGMSAQLHLETTVTERDLAAGEVTFRGDVIGRNADGPVITVASGELPVGMTTGPWTGTTTGATTGTEPGTTTDGTTTDITTTGTATVTETGTTTDVTTTGTATAAGTTAPVGSGAVTGGESVAAGTDSPEHAAVGGAARTGAGVASASAPAAADRTSTSTSAASSATKSTSAAHLAQTGVDTAAALPAAGILGLLGALGLLLGARRRRNPTAD